MQNKVAKMLISNWEVDPDFWYWLKPDQRPSKIDANKFMLASILDYQMRAEVVWENARRLAEDIYDDPESLWQLITSVSLDEWMSNRKEYSIHRFSKGHERVWTIGRRLVHYYEGDARAIWEGQSVEEILVRLNDLRVGEQISRMIVGALIDTRQISGRSDVKVDIHVRRVLGRLLQGNEFGEDDKKRVIELTREMSPENPWLLDRPLYLLGKQVCTATNPKCSECYLNEVCTCINI